MVDRNCISFIWAKTAVGDQGIWHPLLLHMLDVAAVADALMRREPPQSQDIVAKILGLDILKAFPWLLLAIASHDIGKASPGFQSRWNGAPSTGLIMPRIPKSDAFHGFVGQMALTGLLLHAGWEEGLADMIADAVGCHHGSRASEKEKEAARMALILGRGERLEAAREDWDQARSLLFAELAVVFAVNSPPPKAHVSGPEFMWLAGLTSFADWIGSNTTWFGFGEPGDCQDPSRWFRDRKAVAETALDAIGWLPRMSLVRASVDFKRTFGKTPRPLQIAMARVVKSTVTKPAIILLEAPMGEGKTEAAYLAHLELQRRFGHRGMYIALPTKATGNAMFARTVEFLRRLGFARGIDLQLLHGAAILSDEFRALRFSGIDDPMRGGEVRASEWFTHKKRALLSEYGVGTVDQAMVPILPVRHNFVRLWGLANRVVIFDEVHAYDAYTGTLLIHLLRWLLAMGSSIILLSATLPPSFRRRLAELAGSQLPEPEAPYPRLSVFQAEVADQTSFPPDVSRQMAIRLTALEYDLMSMVKAVGAALIGGGLGLILVNTVQRAQESYLLFREGQAIENEGETVGKRLHDGTEVYLFHARFPAGRRYQRERLVQELFGSNRTSSGRRILIATQVAEQSLDLDFDLVATDLAPVDLILQRAGRLWRHDIKDRQVPGPELIVAGLAGDQPPDFGGPLWWGKVYREDILLRSWALLKDKSEIVLPDEIDSLVKAVYEETHDIPLSLRERLGKASELCEGEALAFRRQAHQAIIGMPDDGSWNSPERFLLYDEDEPGVHRTLLARTRLGEDSEVAIVIFPGEAFSREVKPDDVTARRFYMNAISISRSHVIGKLRASGIPEGWKTVPLLRNCYPLVLDCDGRWIDDARVRLDKDLGLVYESEEGH